VTRIRLYGLRLDLPSPMAGTEAIEPEGVADVTVHFAPAPTSIAERERYRSSSADGATPTLIATQRADGAVHLEFAEGARFTVSSDGREVWAEWDAPLTDADAYTFLAGPVLGLALRAHGALALHASAVVFDGAAWAFIGQGGAGKSTLAAACAMDGAAVLAEDLLALRRSGASWLAAAGHHQLRLWPEGEQLLPGGALALPTLTPSWPKRALDLVSRGLPRATSNVPLRGIVVLGARVAPDAEPAAVRLTARDAVVELVAHAYANHLLDGAHLGRELGEWGEIAMTVPAWRLHAGSESAGLRRTVKFLRTLATF
jgi:hypothetical protein